MYRVNIIEAGILLLIPYIAWDFIKNKEKTLLGRIVLYSFIFYLLNIFQLTTGGINIPPRTDLARGAYYQLVPFDFITVLKTHYQTRGADWFFWNSLKLYFYNLIMLSPLGFYFPVLFNIRQPQKVAVYCALVTIIIECYQVVLSRTGLIFPRIFSVDDIILNTLGCVIGFFLYKTALALLKSKFRGASSET